MLSTSLLSLLFMAALAHAAPLNGGRNQTVSTAAKRQSAGPGWIPFYGKSANGHASNVRGWNTFGLQANKEALYPVAGFDFNAFHFQQQCEQMTVRQGYDYVCSLDSGWSKDGGDPHGRFEPNEEVFNWFSDGIKGLSNQLQKSGIKLGIYLLPGAFESDRDAIVEGTNVRLGDILDMDQPWYNLRRSFKWGQPGVQEWHDSVIKSLVNMGVQFIKLDYVTPGSPDSGGDLPSDTSPAVTAFHNAILKYGQGMRLDISWKLSRESPYWQVWKEGADSLRLDQDVNSAGSGHFTQWSTVQRAIENYRIFINQQVLDESRWNQPIMVRPDMDNVFVDKEAVSGLSDVQRYSMAIHWIGAGANLITGSDLLHLDELGRKLLYDEEVMGVADFTSQYPMQPRNPDGTNNPGGPDASQTQAWVAGPDENGTAVVVLSNLGPDGGSGGFGTNDSDVKLVSITLDRLGLGGSGWNVRRVLGGGGSGGGDNSDIGVATEKVESWLGPSESVLYRLSKA